MGKNLTKELEGKWYHHYELLFCVTDRVWMCLTCFSIGVACVLIAKDPLQMDNLKLILYCGLFRVFGFFTLYAAERLLNSPSWFNHAINEAIFICMIIIALFHWKFYLVLNFMQKEIFLSLNFKYLTKKTLVLYVKYFWSNVMECCLTLDLLKFSRIGIWSIRSLTRSNQSLAVTQNLESHQGLPSFSAI